MVDATANDDVDQIRRWIEEELSRCRGAARRGVPTKSAAAEERTVDQFLAEAEAFLVGQTDKEAILARLAERVAHHAAVQGGEPAPVVEAASDHRGAASEDPEAEP